jgi:predicted signal transduction protein with EAL and GGDEF domain
MLRKVGAEYVKMDQSIVAAAATEPHARAVLMAMATFARQTGAFVIAEGIEDEETLESFAASRHLTPDRAQSSRGDRASSLVAPRRRCRQRRSRRSPTSS